MTKYLIFSPNYPCFHQIWSKTWPNSNNFFLNFQFFSSSKLKLRYLRITVKKYFHNLLSISSYSKNIPNGCSNVDQKLTKLVQKRTMGVLNEFNLVQKWGKLPMFSWIFDTDYLSVKVILIFIFILKLSSFFRLPSFLRLSTFSYLPMLHTVWNTSLPVVGCQQLTGICLYFPSRLHF